MTLPYLPFCRPDIRPEDVEAVVDVLESGWITTGSRCEALEALICERVESAHAVAVSSATAAMHLYLHALDIGPGDEVITPSLTWVSMVNLIRLRGAEPVFVDVNGDDLMVRAEAVEAAVTERTRLIVPVHFAGAPLDVEPIRDVARRHGIALLEDAAHALGAQYQGRPVGHGGDAVFSLQATKNVTGAEGGVLVTDDAGLAERIRRLRFHGLGSDAYGRHAQGRRPQAEVLEPGFKYNLPDLCGALALSQLRRVDGINAARRALAARYLEGLEEVGGVRPLVPPSWPHVHAWHLFVVRVVDDEVDRDAFMSGLDSQGVGCGIHFRAVHLQRYYRERPSQRPVDLPVTERVSRQICSLPLFPGMDEHDVDRVVGAIRRVLGGG